MTSQLSHGTGPQFSALQRAVIRQLAAGFSPAEIARLLRVSSRQIRAWLADPAFAAEVERTVASHDAAMQDLLIYGEEVAVTTALMVMQDAVDGRGKIDYKTRLQAALEFLNRKGQRGAPVQSQEVKQLTLTGNMNDALSQALRDPGVRDWLDKEPDVLKALVSGEPSAAQPHEVPSPVELPSSDFEILDGEEDAPDVPAESGS